MLKRLIARLYARPGDMYWKSWGGATVKISEMDDSHVLNSCRLLEEKLPLWATMRAELRRRGLTPKPPRPAWNFHPNAALGPAMLCQASGPEPHPVLRTFDALEALQEQDTY